jgi:DNA-binding CsgD family transcriptional regulator
VTSSIGNESTTTFVSGSPDAVRDEVLDALRLSVDADSAGWHDVTESGLLAAVRSRGAPEAGRLVASYLGRALPSGSMSTESDQVRRLRRGGWTLSNPGKVMRHSFLAMHEVYRSEEVLESLPVFQEFYARAKLTDQLRLLAYRGTRFIGWIAALRSGGRFSREQQQRANGLVRQTIEALAAARTMEALDDDAFLIFDGAGVVERGTERALAWLSRERAEVFARCVCAADRDEGKQFRVDGVSARLVRLAGGESVRYLAMLKDRDSIELSVGAGLSPMERTVAEDLAAGLTIPEIAASRGRAESTVKSQAKNIYRKLGVASRLELVEALRGEAP